MRRQKIVTYEINPAKVNAALLDPKNSSQKARVYQLFAELKRPLENEELMKEARARRLKGFVGHLRWGLTDEGYLLRKVSYVVAKSSSTTAHLRGQEPATPVTASPNGAKLSDSDVAITEATRGICGGLEKLQMIQGLNRKTFEDVKAIVREEFEHVRTRAAHA